VKVAAMLATAGVPDDHNGNAWTRGFIQEMERLAKPLLK